MSFLISSHNQLFCGIKTMKFFKSFFALLMCGIVSLTFSCGGNNGASDKTLVMATNAEFPPYEYIGADGDFTGIDVELMRTISKNLGYELKIENIAFDSIIPSLLSGKADIGVAGMSVTEDRKKNVDFTITYAGTKQVIIVRAGSAIKAPADLTGKKIGVQTGTTGDIEATAIKDAKVSRFQKGVETILALRQNKLDAVVIDDFPARTFVSKANPGELVILGTPLAVEEYAMAVKKGNAELLAVINAEIAKLKQDGTIQKIYDKYNAELMDK
jgi:polar amino acid transport system substrate-binding protein